MEGVKLLGKRSFQEVSFDVNSCIICQRATSQSTTSTENGRAHVQAAADVREDIVTKRLKLIDGEVFVYHMSNDCYKKYTMQKTLDAISKKRSSIEKDASSPNQEPSTSTSQRYIRGQTPCRAPPKEEPDMYKDKCVVCAQIKMKEVCKKFRISESERAKKFLLATVYFQDEVYTRTCDLQDINRVFGADLYCHKLCIKKYLSKYDQVLKCPDKARPVSDKLQAWSVVVAKVDVGLGQGEGYELSYIRDSMNKLMGSSGFVTNKEVKVLLVNHFGDGIMFSHPKQANQSIMCFSKECTTEHMAETIRFSDPITECAEMIRKSLLEIDFDLQDRFCDSGDLEDALHSMKIPDPLLSFLAVLYNFDKNSYENKVSDRQDPDEEEIEDIHDGVKTKLSSSKCRKMQTMFQILYYNLHNGRKRTPIHIMNSQVIYDTCKSATLIKSFNRLGLCNSYDELLRLQNDMASLIIEKNSHRVPFPSNFDPKQFTVAAFDNFDHNEATLSGIGGCHDTVTVLFQEDTFVGEGKPKVSETNIRHGSKTFHAELKCQSLLTYHKPAKKPDIPASFKVQAEPPPANKDILKESAMKDVAWTLSRLDLCETDEGIVKVNPVKQKVPTWSACNSVWSKEDIPVMRVAFLPVIPYPVTEYHTVYTAMKNMVDLLSQLDQAHLAITVDEGVYHIAREIQLHKPDEFKDIVLCMGSFHMTKVVLGCIGKYLRGSGAENIWVESGIFGVNVVDSVLSGKNYVRSVKGMQLLGEAMARLQWAAFFDKFGVEKYGEAIDVLLHLKQAVNHKKHLESSQQMEEFCTGASPLMDDFQQFVHENSEKNETFKYWNTFLDLISVLRNLIRSDREGNWELHLQAVQDALPLFAVMDSTNYLRWCTLYLEDMRKLPETAPELYRQFLRGKFVVKRTPGPFKAVGVDMSLEQTINRSQKSTSGIIGSTRKKDFVAKWELTYHEMLATCNLHRQITGIKTKAYELVVNHEFNNVETVTGEKNVQAIITFIESHENPFLGSGTEMRLHNILTQEVMNQNIRDQILNVGKIGQERYQRFRNERFVARTKRFCDTIHRQNLQTFQHIRSSNSAKRSTGKKQINRQSVYQSRVLDIARCRGIPMDELLKFDVTPVSTLFDENGLMKKAIKSDLQHKLDKSLNMEGEMIPSLINCPLPTAYIIDFMSTIRKLRLKEIPNFGSLCDTTIQYIISSCKLANRIDIIFDYYMKHSIKDSERKRRSCISPIELGTINRVTPLPVEMSNFWASSENKQNLQILLHEEAIKQADSNYPAIQFISSYIPGEYPSPCLSVLGSVTSEISELHVDTEEADSRIIQHAMHATNNGIKRIIVLSTDSDVMVLLLHYWTQLKKSGLQELWVKTGVGDSTRFTPIHTLASTIGVDVCRVLPAVHCLTGCDYTSKIGTKNAAMEAKPCQYLKDFGFIQTCPDVESQISSAEEYLVQVLKRGTDCKTMDQLRNWMYHHNKRHSLGDLPPTSNGIKAHIKRAYYATHTMVTLLDSQPTVLDPIQYGYHKEDDLLMPELAIQPIPEEYALYCNCTKCANARCICRKKGEPCCKFCKCHISQDTNLICLNPSGYVE